MQQTRHHHVRIIASLLMLLAALAASAASRPCTAQEPIDERRAEELIARLDSPQLAVRNQAESALTALGPGLLPWLQQQAGDIRWTSESRHRMARVRSRLFQQLIDGSRTASQVNLPAGLGAEESSETILQQTGNVIEVRFSDPPTDLPASRGEFWLWLERFADRHELQIDYSSIDKLRLLPLTDDQQSRPAAVGQVGPLRVEFLVRQANASGTASQLQFRLLWEPRIKPVAIRIPLEGFSSLDGQGDTWATFNRQAVLSIPVSGHRYLVRFRVPLRQTSSAEPALITVPVQLVMMAPAFSGTFRDVTQQGPFPRLRGGMADVTISRTDMQNRQLTIRMETRYDSRQMAQPLQSHLVWSKFTSASLHHHDGRVLKPAETRDVGQEPYRFVMEFLFDLPAGVDDNWDLKFQLPAGLTLIDESIQLSIDP